MILAASDPVIWGIVLIGCAFILAGMEVFIPSMGLIAAVAGLFATAGVVALFQESNAWGLTGLGSVIVGGACAIVFAVRVLPHTPMGRGLILGSDIEDEQADAAAPPSDRRNLEAALVGAEGVATSSLHPVGTADIEGARVEVIARTGVIERGSRLKVVEVRGNEVFVRPLD